MPPRTGPIGGDLGDVKYGTFVGDNRTPSITRAIPNDDDELRRRLLDPVAFDASRSLAADNVSGIRGCPLFRVSAGSGRPQFAERSLSLCVARLALPAVGR